MFSRELLSTRKRKPYISPVYIGEKEIALAEKVISIYEKQKPRAQIQEETASLETHKNFRIIRGLSELMRRRTTFEAVFSVEPGVLREYLYRKGYAVTEKERTLILKKAGEEFGLSVKDIEDSFWADREEFHIVVEVADISAQNLIKYYNLSLTQTLLFDAISLEFTTSGNFQEIFRTIKFLGLMYEVLPDKTSSESSSNNPRSRIPNNHEKSSFRAQQQNQVTIRVTGPASLFRKTKKYGTSLAKLLPKIMKAPTWKIRASIETTVAGEPRIYKFELSDSKRELFPAIAQDDEVHFDSSIEEDFLRRFSNLRRDWEVKREPTLLKTGSAIMIPDFSLERREKKFYIEIVGFWTPEYLEKKAKKVKGLTEEITLCVSKELQCTKKDFEKENVDVIFYDKRIPMKPILEKIRKIESEQLEEEKEKLSTLELPLNEQVIPLSEIAVRYKVGIESVKKALEPHRAGVVAGDVFVRNTVLKEVEENLKNLKDMRLFAVKKILDEYELNEEVLKEVGYEVEWKTLDVEQATVRKRKDK